jgi:hypothetical protein
VTAAPFWPRTEETGCLINIEHSETSLHAHVELDGDLQLQPGDRVKVHGAPIKVVFGDRLELHRRATIRRAGWMAREWTKLSARFALSELYEVSFTSGSLL